MPARRGAIFEWRSSISRFVGVARGVGRYVRPSVFAADSTQMPSVGNAPFHSHPSVSVLDAGVSIAKATPTTAIAQPRPADIG